MHLKQLLLLSLIPARGFVRAMENQTNNDQGLPPTERLQTALGPVLIMKFYHESNAIETCEQEEKKRLHSCNEEITDFVRADDNSSRSNISSIIAQNEMKSEKAQAAFNLFREYDYRIECEGKQPGCVDPIRLYFQKKRMQRILAVGKRRRL